MLQITIQGYFFIEKSKLLKTIGREKNHQSFKKRVF